MKWLLSLDVVVVLTFAAAGRASHDSGSGVTDVLETAAPFLMALVLGWFADRAWLHPIAPRTGIVIWAWVILAGMVLRRLGFARGTAPSFILVATLVVGAGVLGWRTAARLAQRSRARRSARR
jgi:hypothetical protein